jgi:Family of unknown function (DUF6152)
MQLRSLIVGLSLVAPSTLPLEAHHSFAAEYDSNKPISIKGVVRKLAWVNPHAYIYVDVRDDSGKVVTWAFETLSPNALARQGWNSSSLKFGDIVSIEGYLARDPTPLPDGSLHGNARIVTRADGRRVFSGNADDGGPNR